MNAKARRALLRPPKGAKGVVLEVWNQVMPDLVERGFVTARIDRMFVELYCDSVHTVDVFERLQDEYGEDFIIGGETRPLREVVEEYRDAMYESAELIGLTPRARREIEDRIARLGSNDLRCRLIDRGLVSNNRGV